MQSSKKRPVTRQLWFWVLCAIAGGIVFGLAAPGPAGEAKWLADAFLALVRPAPVVWPSGRSATSWVPPSSR